jgi:hypothetical protein
MVPSQPLELLPASLMQVNNGSRVPGLHQPGTAGLQTGGGSVRCSSGSRRCRCADALRDNGRREGVREKVPSPSCVRTHPWYVPPDHDGLRDGLGLSSQEFRVLFVALDSSQSDQIRFGPFIETLRGSPSPQRLESIKQVFSTIDSDKDGLISLSDIGACLNPKVECGRLIGPDSCH